MTSGSAKNQDGLGVGRDAFVGDLLTFSPSVTSTAMATPTWPWAIPELVRRAWPHLDSVRLRGRLRCGRLLGV